MSLWNTPKLNRSAVLNAFDAHVAAGSSRSTAHEHVGVELNDIVADLIDNGLPTDSVVALCQWWHCDVDYIRVNTPSASL